MQEKTPKAKSAAWSQIISPILALVVICAILSFLLGMTNAATRPLIDQNTQRVAEEARQALLPEADGFEEVTITVDVPGATALYASTNDVGYIIEASGNGYGGAIPAMIAFTADGTISGVTFLQNDETPGLGKKLESDPSFAAQFEGLDAQPVTIDQIDKIASSTISTNGALSAINAAVTLYNEQVLGQGIDAVTDATAEATASSASEEEISSET